MSGISLKTAAIQAAAHIQNRPESYDFMSGSVPRTQNDCGCILAWIGYFMDVPADTGYYKVAAMTGLPPEMAVELGDYALKMLGEEKYLEKYKDSEKSSWYDPDVAVSYLLNVANS